jgi:hypothetical protein
MPAPADVYRSVHQAEELSSGDIAYLSLARTRLSGELPPGDEFDGAGRVPAYPRPAVLPLPHGREIAVDSMFALVVTHSCEIDRQRNANVAAAHLDCRLSVAPIVSEAAVTLVNTDGSTDGVNWTAIEANIPLASLTCRPSLTSRSSLPTSSLSHGRGRTRTCAVSRRSRAGWSQPTVSSG